MKATNVKKAVDRVVTAGTAVLPDLGRQAMMLCAILLLLFGALCDGIGRVFDGGNAFQAVVELGASDLNAELTERAPVFAFASEPCAKKHGEGADGDAEDLEDLWKDGGIIHMTASLFAGIVTGVVVTWLGVLAGRRR